MLALAVLLLLLCCAGAAAECGYTYLTASGHYWHYNLTQLQSDTDYLIRLTNGTTVATNVCAQPLAQCLPVGGTQGPTNGAATRFWGPRC